MSTCRGRTAQRARAGARRRGGRRAPTLHCVLDLGDVVEVLGVGNPKRPHAVRVPPLLEVPVKVAPAAVHLAAADLARELDVEAVELVEPVRDRLAVPPERQVQRVVDGLSVVVIVVIVVVGGGSPSPRGGTGRRAVRTAAWARPRRLLHLREPVRLDLRERLGLALLHAPARLLDHILHERQKAKGHELAPRREGQRGGGTTRARQARGAHGRDIHRDEGWVAAAGAAAAAVEGPAPASAARSFFG